MNTCAIVILNYNGAEVLGRFLPSVVGLSCYDVWVIDNASTDGSTDLLKNRFPRISLMILEANHGYAGGYNHGLEPLKDKYRYFVLLNSDVEVTEGWDVDLISWLEAHPGHAAVQPKILSWQDKGLFDYAGAGGGYLDSLGYPYCRGRIWDTLEPDHGQYDDEVRVDWASGACMAVRSSDFYEEGGFDSLFFAHMEEIDLCWRMRKSGKKIGYFGSVTVYHQGGATLDRTSPNKLYLNVRNSLIMLFKNSPGFRFGWIFLMKLIFEGGRALGYLVQGKKEFSRAIFSAYVDFLKIRKQYRRADKKPDVKVPGGSGPAKLISWDYWVMGKKKFSDL